MGDVVKMVPADQEAEPDIETLKTNFRKQFASLCIAAEFSDLPRTWILEHIDMVRNQVAESLTPEGQERERKILRGE